MQCQRDPQSFELVDVSLPAYQALRVITAASAQRGTLTLAQACDLVRGLGGGSFSNTQGKNKGKGKVDVVAEAGAKVALNKDVSSLSFFWLVGTHQFADRIVSSGY